MVANLVDFHFTSPSSSEGNIINLSINKAIVLISLSFDIFRTLHISMSSPVCHTLILNSSQ